MSQLQSATDCLQHFCLVRALTHHLQGQYREALAICNVGLRQRTTLSSHCYYCAENPKGPTPLLCIVYCQPYLTTDATSSDNALLPDCMGAQRCKDSSHRLQSRRRCSHTSLQISNTTLLEMVRDHPKLATAPSQDIHHAAA